MYGKIYNYTTEGLRLTSVQLACYAAICLSMDYQTSSCTITYERVGQIAGCSRDTARYCIKHLIKVGLIDDITHKTTQITTHNTTHCYAVLLKGLRQGDYTQHYTQHYTENYAHNNNNNINKNININNTHTPYIQNNSAGARAKPGGGYKVTLDTYKEMELTPNIIRKYTYCTYWQAVNGFKAFIRMTSAKGKIYTDVADARAHCLDWIKAKYLRYSDIPKAAAHEAEILAKEEQDRHR